MVQYASADLDTSFDALSDAIRRGVLEQFEQLDALLGSLGVSVSGQ